MPASRSLKRLRRPPDRYHHGHLRQALVEEALRMIQHGGVEALTLRAAGERLGVSRTALYRHFSDKNALLAAVARDGFVLLGEALTAAWRAGGGRDGGRAALTAMGAAYIQFAQASSSHYRVMFGRLRADVAPDPELAAIAPTVFQVLVDALIDLQREGLVHDDDPVQLARYVWAVVHGLAMLAIDGHLAHQQAEVAPVLALSLERLWTGLGVSRAPRVTRRVS